MKISLICLAVGVLFGFSGCSTDEVTTTTTTEETTLARPVTSATTTETHVVRTE